MMYPISKKILKLIFGYSVITSLCFLFLYLNTCFFKLDFVLLGVFKELMLLPILLTHTVFFVILSVDVFSKIKHVRRYALLTWLVLGISLLFVIKSFFNK